MSSLVHLTQMIFGSVTCLLHSGCKSGVWRLQVCAPAAVKLRLQATTLYSPWELSLGNIKCMGLHLPRYFCSVPAPSLTEVKADHNPIEVWHLDKKMKSQRKEVRRGKATWIPVRRQLSRRQRGWPQEKTPAITLTSDLKIKTKNKNKCISVEVFQSEVFHSSNQIRLRQAHTQGMQKGRRGAMKLNFGKQAKCWCLTPECQIDLWSS